MKQIVKTAYGEWLNVYSSAMKMEATFYAKTSADLQWITQLYIPEDRIILKKSNI
jgi:hypothetical protein